MTRQMWTEEDKEKLLEATIASTKNNRIQWALVAEQFKSRTLAQCKSQYINRLGIQFERKNVSWGSKELRQLYEYALYHGKRWTFICENFYQSRFTPEALIYQYKMVQKIYQEMEAECSRVLSRSYQLSKKTVFLFYQAQKLLRFSNSQT